MNLLQIIMIYSKLTLYGGYFMIDIKFLRDNPDLVKENIKKKFQDHKLELVDQIISLDKKHRELQLEGDTLRMERNSTSKEIGNLMNDTQAFKHTVLQNYNEKEKKLKTSFQDL